MKYDAVVKTPVGKIGIRSNDGRVTNIDFDVAERRKASADPATIVAVEALMHYFEDATASIELPLSLRGTDFQRRVWKELQKIGAGEVMTYAQLARKLKSAPRAVGQACKKNPCPIIVPCHRVISSTGIGGFAGETEGKKVSLKRWLLRHEGIAI